MKQPRRAKPQPVSVPVTQPSNDNEGRPDFYTIHLRVDGKELAELDTIVGWMRTDPELQRLRLKIGREKALRYAVGRLIASPPEHVGVGQG
jgi:hypothetical protein